MNLFKKIFNENLRKNKEPVSKFVDDVGYIKGKFSWTKINNDGSFGEKHTLENAVVADGRSSVMRLLAQGTSEKVGAIIPSSFRIARMRFGNMRTTQVGGFPNSGPEMRRHYMDIRELSSRYNATGFIPVPPLDPLTPTSELRGAGGVSQTNSSLIENAPNGAAIVKYSIPGITISTFNTTNPVVVNISDLQNMIKATESIPARKPSDGTLVVSLYRGPNPTDLIETIKFDSEYTKSINGNFANQLNNSPIILPTIPSTKVFNLNETKLFYDVDKRWKLIIVAIPSSTSGFEGNQVTRVVVSFEIGKYNVINSIVPAFGFNRSSGTSNIIRFNGQRNFYSITTTTYSDGANNPIEDYSVNFSCIMGANEGNGEGSEVDIRNILYTEAFLFNERDELFSIIRMPNEAGFIKNPQTAYLLTWQLSIDPN